MINNENEPEDFGSEILGPISREIENGGCALLKEFIKEHCDFALDIGFMFDAVEYDNTDALKVFVDAGVHPDSVCPELHGPCTTPLWNAINYRAYSAATFLLDAGANLEHSFGGTIPTPLISAASEGDLKMVKMLLDRGANIHATYLRDGTERFNALKWAVLRENEEVANYLRSQGAVMLTEEEEANLCPNANEEVIVGLSDYFQGKPKPLGLMEIVPASVPLSVRIFPPVRGKRKSTVFATSGLIEYALVTPEGKEKYWYAEYFIEMPGTWPTKDEDLVQEKYFWPIHWLKAISRYPHEQETYYGEKKTVTAKMIPSLTTPDGKYDSALVERVSDLEVQTSDGRNILIYRITPLKSSKKNE